MKKKNKTPLKKAKEIVNAAQLSGRNMAQLNHSQVPGCMDDYFIHKSLVEEQYEKYREQELKWELYKEITAALVSKWPDWPTRTENAAQELARAAVNLTDISYSEWKR